MRDTYRGLLALGAGCVVLSMLALLLRAALGGGASSASGLDVLKLFALVALVSLWALAPFAALYRLQNAAAPLLRNDIVLLVASALVSALALLAIVPTFLSARPSPTGAAVMLMFIPLYQWVLTGAAWGLCTVLPGRQRRED